MSQPAISIVLPTYNGQRFLAQSIESCIQQTFSDWELIIVDDGSTDATPGIIDDYTKRDPRIRSVRLQSNGRLPHALNRGFAEAKAPLLTWTSDDNLYRPEALARLAEFLVSHPDVALVYASAKNIDATGRKIGTYPVGPPHHLVFRNCIGACFLYRREVHDRLGGYAEDRVLVEDYDFWLRASRIFKLAFLREDLYLYRKHGASLTASQWQVVQQMADETLREYLDSLPWMNRRLRASAYVRFARGAFQRRDFAAMREDFLRGFRMSPSAAVADGGKVLLSTLARRVRQQ